MKIAGAIMNKQIFVILLTKNENDIIEYCIRNACEWADKILVYDGASDDGTWEIVQNLADKCEKIIAWKSEKQVFREGLRADVFNAFKHEAKDGDWWCQLNADELFDSDIRGFLQKRSGRYDVIWGLMAQFYPPKELINAPLPTKRFEIDRYKDFEWVPTGEPRFFRHRRRLSWSPENAWPRHLGICYEKRFLMKHFPYRTKEQIKKRIEVRLQHRESGFEGWNHLDAYDGNNFLSESKDLISYDQYKGLPNPPFKMLCAPLESPHRRILKSIMHRLRIFP